MIDTKFSYKQKVKITKGFYKGYKAVIKSYIETKANNEEIIYSVKIDGEGQEIKVSESSLRGLTFGFL